MTPHVQGEPIVQGSDFGLLAPQGAKDLLLHNVHYATGEHLSTVNKSIERAFCVMSDPCEFNNDNEVVSKMLETYGNMSTKSQAAGASVTGYHSTVDRGEEKAGQPASSSPLPTVL